MEPNVHRGSPGKHLRWTEDEINTVAKGAVYHLQKGSGHTRQSAILAAQDRYLKPERRKTHFTAAIKKTLDDKIDNFGSTPFDQLNLKEPAAVTPPNEQPAPAPQQPKIEIPELSLGAALATIVRELGKEIIAQNEARFAKVEERMQEMIEHAISKNAMRLVPAVAHELGHSGHNGHNGHGANGGNGDAEKIDTTGLMQIKPKKIDEKAGLPDKFYEPKVMFIGLIAKQPESVQRLFPHIDMRFMEGSLSRSKVQQMSKNVEYCYIMGRHAPGKLKLDCQHSIVNGGVSNLCTLLRERFGTSGEEAAAKRAERKAKH